MPRKLEYTSPEEEIQQLMEAFEKESISEREEFTSKMDLVSLPERIQNGVTIHPLEITDTESFLGDTWKIFLSPKNPLPRFHSFHPGTPISIFQKDERHFGQVHKIQNNEIIILIDGDIPEWLEEGNVGIDLFYSEKSYKEGKNALTRLLEGKNDRKELRDFLLGYKTRPNFSEEPVVFESIGKKISPEFNPSQKTAIRRICSTRDCLVIQGPPGTGKTSVLVEAIRLLVENGQKVLISTPTNSALDLLLEKTLPIDLKPIRIGQTSRVPESLLPYTIDFMAEKHPLTKNINKYQKQANNLRKKATRFHRNFGAKQREERASSWQDYRGIKETIRNTERQLEKELIQTSNPVLATNVSASQSILNKIDFDICILDEATQSLEPIAWIPILRSPVVVFAGDENQLPPTILSEDQTLLNTLFLKVTETFRDTDRFCFLDIQYRMEEEILGFSNREFYNNKVKTDISVQNRTKLHKDVFQSAFVFIDTAGTGYEEEKSEESESTKNTGEAEVIRNVLDFIFSIIPIEQEQVGIIAPYKEQVYTVRETLGENYKDIEVSTVDSFQGREKDIILLTMTRSNDEGEIGFLRDYRRMNVSLTRARKLLIVVGDSVTLSQDAFYSRFLDYAKESGDYRSGYEFMAS